MLSAARWVRTSRTTEATPVHSTSTSASTPDSGSALGVVGRAESADEVGLAAGS